MQGENEENSVRATLLREEATYEEKEIDQWHEEEEEEEEGSRVKAVVRWGRFVAEVKRQGVIATPMIFVNMFQFLLQVISVMMVGHLGRLSLSSASIAFSLCSVTGFTVLLGMASALETLCGQAFGAQQYQKVGIYMQRAVVVLLLVCIPLSLFWTFLAKFLLLIGQEPAISHEAGRYAVCLIPGLFAAALLQPLVRFLQSQSLVLPLLFGAVVTLCFHVPVCWLLLFKSELGHIGAAISVSMSYWLNVVILALYVRFSSSCKKTFVPLSMEAFAGTREFVRLALPSAVMICLEYWSYEMLILLSGLLPDPELETSVLSICLNTIYLLYSIPYGLGAAASTRVSNELGAGCPRAAQLAVFVVVCLAAVDIAIVSTAVFSMRCLLGLAYSSDKDVIDYVVKMAPLLSLATSMDALQGVLSGVARGCGWQDLGAYVNLGAYYLLGIPTATILAFMFHFGGRGLWIGVYCGATAQTILLALIAGLMDWQQQTNKARDRVLDKPDAHNGGKA